MAVLSDLFNGTLSNWTQGTADWSIVSGKARLTNAVSWIRYTGASLSSNDHFSEVEWFNVAVTNGQGGGAAARMNAGGAQTFYGAEWQQVSGTNKKYLLKMSAGDRTILATSDQATISAGDLLRVTCNGTTISASFNASQYGSVTDASFTSSVVGMFGNPAGGGGRILELESWNAADLVTPAGDAVVDDMPYRRRVVLSNVGR